MLCQGCKWRAINRPEARWNSVYQYYRRWCQEGLWEVLWEIVCPPLRKGEHFIDATHVKAHRCAANAAGGREHQALGRTKGGLNTKIHAVVDRRGTPASLFLSAGNEADISHAQTVVRYVPASALVGDKGYDSDAFRDWLRVEGITPCIPPRSNRKRPERYSRPSYRRRHLVENFFERIKNFRRVATRYDKLALTYMGFVHLGVALLWLR